MQASETSPHRQWASFSGRLLMIGFGCIGQGALPLLLRHIAIRPEQISILSPGGREIDLGAAQGVTRETLGLTRDNHSQINRNASGSCRLQETPARARRFCKNLN